MKHFWYLEHTADLKFRAQGKSLEECFINSARALTNSIVNLGSIEGKKERQLAFKEKDLDLLLNQFLSELVYIFDTDHFLFSEYEVEIEGVENQYDLHVKMKGEEYSEEKHETKTHIKAVTFHQLFVKKKQDRWVSQVICDI